MRALLAVIGEWQTRPLSWANNCAVFAADCVKAQSGFDPLHDVRHLLTSARGFAQVLREGDGSLASVVTQRLGNRTVPRRARRGDIVGVDRHGLHLGVCMGSTALFLGDDGLIPLPMRAVSCAWGVHG